MSVIIGDCLDVLPTLEANSFHSCVTDPPYHLTSIVKRFGAGNAEPAKSNGATGVYRRASAGFMGQQWDGGDVAMRPETWAAVLRVLRPGAHLVAFGGTRTSHRVACAIEDAGFEIRDTLMWIYGSGFPKSHNQSGDWAGYGTALKPAWEPIILARKPLDGTVAANLAKWGCGAINVDGCRVGEFVNTTPPGTDRYNKRNHELGYRPSAYGRDGEQSANRRYNDSGSTNFAATPGPRGGSPEGRWPANLVHDGSDEVVGCFPSAPGQIARESSSSSRENQNTYGAMKRGSNGRDPREDAGSAARFFYCAKASRADRNDGCEALDAKPLNWSSGDQSPGTFQAEGTDKTARNPHPTVKPTELMRWLVRLVTPPGGHVLDPFTGSGSTGRGCVLEGMGFTGIEKGPEYAEIARLRIAAAEAKTSDGPLFAKPTQAALL